MAWTRSALGADKLTDNERCAAWYERPELLKLRRKWYAKLSKSGFEDIEHIDWSTGDSGNLLSGVSRVDVERHWSSASQRYYELARQHSWEMKGTGLERRVWTLHAEGLSNWEISRRVRRYAWRTWRQCTRARIASIISKQRAIMLAHLSL